MTPDLRSLLEDFSDGEGRALQQTSAVPSVEAKRLWALVRRRRAVRVTRVFAGAAAAAVLVGALAAQGLPSPPRPAPPATGPTEFTSPATSPAPSTAPSPATTTVPAPGAEPVAPSGPPPPSDAVTVWPAAVAEAMVYEPGRWWAVWLAVAEYPDQLPDMAALEALGYAPTATRGQCMPPSIEALGVSGAGLDWWGEVLYFASADDASTFVESWGKPVTGVVEDVHPACDYH